MRSFFCVPLFCVGLAAQAPADANLTGLTRDLRGAVGRDSFASAADLADKLDEAVQRRYEAWLIRDSGQRVNDVLTWLPADIESWWVNQEPFTVKAEDSVDLSFRRPIQAYSMDRLMTLNGGAFQRALANHTVRLVVSAARHIRENRDTIAIPGVAGSQEVVYFYFFADPIDLRAADDLIQGRPAWRATAKILADSVPRRGVTAPQIEDENWLVLARPDVLVLSNRREMLTQILGGMATQSKTRALPANLPEWAHVDRSASFWGLRHSSVQSMPTAGLPHPDSAASSVTVRFDGVTQQVEIQYLSTELPSRNATIANLQQRFHIDQPEAGVWRLTCDVPTKGAYPVQFAMSMLGYGAYR